MDIKEQLDKLQKAAKDWYDQKDADAKMEWIRNRAEQYAEKFNKTTDEIIAIWESKRNYSFMNYYQECNIPDLSEKQTILQSDWLKQAEDRFGSIKNAKFVCPSCGHIQGVGEFLRAGLDVNESYQCCASRFPELHYKNDKCKWTTGGLLNIGGLSVLNENTLKIVNVFDFTENKN